MHQTSIDAAATWAAFLVNLIVFSETDNRPTNVRHPFCVNQHPIRNRQGKDVASHRAITPKISASHSTALTRNTFSGFSFLGYVISYLLPQIPSGANPPVAAGHPLSEILVPSVLSYGFDSSLTISMPVQEPKMAERLVSRM